MNKETAIEIICALLVFLFVYAATSKLCDYTQFKLQLSHSPLIASYTGILAWLVPSSELTIVTMLTAMHTRKYKRLQFYGRIEESETVPVRPVFL